MNALILLTIFVIGFPRDAVIKEIEPAILRVVETTESEYSPYEAFGELTFEFVETDNPGYSCWSTLKCYGSQSPLDDEKGRGLLIYEMGHVLLNRLNLTYEEIGMNLGYYENGVYVHVTGVNKEGKFVRTPRGYKGDYRPYVQHPTSVPGTGQTYQEDFADMFMNWALDNFSDDVAGQLRKEFMENFIKSRFLRSAAINKSTILYKRRVTKWLPQPK